MGHPLSCVSGREIIKQPRPTTPTHHINVLKSRTDIYVCVYDLHVCGWLGLNRHMSGQLGLDRHTYVLELKNRDKFHRRRRRDLSNLPLATTGYRRDPGGRRPSPVLLAFTDATGIHQLHQHSPAPPLSYGTILIIPAALKWFICN